MAEIMNTTKQPTTALSRFFPDWLRPETIFDRDLFDTESNFLPMRLGVNVPSVNIKETPKEFTLEVAAPGLKREDFRVELDNHTLTISAEKEEKKEKGKESDDYCRREYSYQSFTRSFTLPVGVKEENIDAKYENGILMVHVPKLKESATPTTHKIAVS